MYHEMKNLLYWHKSSKLYHEILIFQVKLEIIDSTTDSNTNSVKLTIVKWNKQELW